MRLSEFKRAMTEEFGAQVGSAIIRDLVLDEIGGKTAEAALAEGLPIRDIWLAICKSLDVPKDRWYAVGLIKPR